MNEENKIHQEYGEINLIDYVRVLFKRRKLILVLVLLSVIGAVIFNWFSEKVYENEIILEIGTIEENLIESPNQIIGKINSSIYKDSILEKLNIPSDSLKIKPINPLNTNLVKIEVEYSNSKKTENILEELTNLILNEHQKEITSQKEVMERSIKTTEEKKKLVESDIEKTRNKIKSIDSDIGRIKNKISFLEEEKKNLEDKEKNLEQLSPYQQLNQQLSGSLFNLLDIREKLSLKKQEIENLYLRINSLEQNKEDLEIQVNSSKANIEDLNAQINSLRETLKDIKPTNVVKPPISSASPIKPKSLINIGISIFLGLFLGVFLAFFREWWQKSSSELKV